MSDYKFISEDEESEKVGKVSLQQMHSGVRIYINDSAVCMFVSGTDYITLYNPDPTTGLSTEHGRVKVGR